jgi:putative hydrolase of the HAD superfamily
MTTVWVDNGSDHGDRDADPGAIDHVITDVGEWLETILEGHDE